ncbi:GDSL-like Lipase/Acylhydrolase-domain-containing protein [Mycotypha africana]|uniref:GDSL-like Lipase/Acylhydrolase-domain-containing protein n=1 Tax=Mycotypha africana TaxID=64632 RepID=UPI002300F30C|nr:GDSL-like Lipase/Acylhydrolase-domain-containing protein [Mycotypha africana]KAI8967895.1 GDSL-like Lipase/Acylhydrolase-domain-containing protein [Mycotypha africana]
MQICQLSNALILFSIAVVSGASVKNIVVFGDSYSDVGNVQRWSNGPNWSEYLAAAWNSSLYNFAYSGAVCDSGKYKTMSKEENRSASLRDQLEAYYRLNLKLDPAETVYAFWIGVQDVFEMGKNSQEPDYKGIVDCIGQQLRAARKVFLSDRYLVLNVPPIGKMPYYQNSEIASNKSQAAIDINRGLEKDVTNLNKHHHALEMDYVDIHTLINDIVINPSIFGFKNSNSSYLDDCYSRSECSSNENGYIWWDRTHFTSAFHKVIAKSIVEAGSYMPEAVFTSDIEKELESPNSKFHSKKYVVKSYEGIFDDQAKMFDLQRMQPIEPQQFPLDDETKSLYYTANNNAISHKSSEAAIPAWTLAIAILIICIVAWIKFRKTDDQYRGKFVPVRNECG